MIDWRCSMENGQGLGRESVQSGFRDTEVGSVAGFTSS